MVANGFLRYGLAGMLFFAMAGIAQAQGVSESSSWLELVKGPRGDIVGVQLVDIQSEDSDDTQTMMVAIPKSGLGNRDDIEEVLVLGSRLPEPEKSLPIEFSYEWVADYDNDNYGLVIRLGKDTNWPIRLYMNSKAGFVD